MEEEGLIGLVEGTAGYLFVLLHEGIEVQLVGVVLVGLAVLEDGGQVGLYVLDNASEQGQPFHILHLPLLQLVEYHHSEPPLTAPHHPLLHPDLRHLDQRFYCEVFAAEQEVPQLHYQLAQQFEIQLYFGLGVVLHVAFEGAIGGILGPGFVGG